MKTLSISPRAINALKPDLSIRDFLPLLVMFALVCFSTAAAVGITYFNFHLAMSYFMAFFFLFFGVLKTINLSDFADAYSTYDILAKRSRKYALTYPFIELVLGFLYLFNIAPLATNACTAILMTVSAYGVWRELRKDTYMPCACLGTVFTIPMTHVTFVEDTVMALMAATMVVLILFVPGIY